MHAITKSYLYNRFESHVYVKAVVRFILMDIQSEIEMETNSNLCVRASPE